MKIGGWLFAAVFVTIRASVTIAFDCMLVYGMIRQAQAQHWPVAMGHVTSAKVETESDSESGTSYKAKIEYTYAVDGVPFTASRVRFGFNSSSSRSASAIVQKYRAGSRVDVHYNPRDPSMAVLQTIAIGAPDLFGFIFMMPFNMITLFGLRIAWMGVSGQIAREQKAPAGSGVVLINDGGVTRLRLTRSTPFNAALMAVGATSFALIFILAFTFGTESMNAVAAGWAVIAGASVFAYRWMRQRIANGWYDLLIDDARRVLTLPGKLKSEANEVAFDSVASIDVDKKTGTGDDSDQFFTTLRQPSGRSAQLLKTTDRQAAEALASYLRNRVDANERARAAATQDSL